ncbi:hypothetical protein CBR_g19083 [Chara braunii]|uniref:Uncharacterized protein n=2 Tax=Streptophytina TaxID=131221 RepID=A0A388KX97_CHABU|nr:hypothetical protein CBR_g19083 [Chara braunii]|eukprot:GBG74675.1 hypothetical protein CBR_g19083 [Chara braunii]
MDFALVCSPGRRDRDRHFQIATELRPSRITVWCPPSSSKHVGDLASTCKGRRAGDLSPRVTDDTITGGRRHRRLIGEEGRGLFFSASTSEQQQQQQQPSGCHYRGTDEASMSGSQPAYYDASRREQRSGLAPKMGAGGEEGRPSPRCQFCRFGGLASLSMLTGDGCSRVSGDKTKTKTKLSCSSSSDGGGHQGLMGWLARSGLMVNCAARNRDGDGASSHPTQARGGGFFWRAEGRRKEEEEEEEVVVDSLPPSSSRRRHRWQQERGRNGSGLIQFVNTSSSVSSSSSSSSFADQAAKKKKKKQREEQQEGEGVTWRTVLVGAIAGGTAGVSVETLLYPIDTIKTRLQAARSGGGIVFKGLYSGWAGNLIGVIPASALFVGVYEPAKQKLLEVFPPHLSSAAHLTAGALGGAAASLVRVPTEVVKQRMQTGQFASATGAVKGILAKEGFKGLYAGFGSFLLRDLPFDAMQFCMYEQLKLGLKSLARRELRDEEMAVIGAVSGALTGAITTPLDVIKTRLMVQGTSSQYRGVADCIATVWREEGPHAFMKGIGPRVLWIGIGGSIFFGVLEKTKAALDKMHTPLVVIQEPVEA